jgi:hypothetical protein
MEIIIGRKPETNQLKITIGKQAKVCGTENSVPNSVSRTHFSLTAIEGGGFTLKNLNPANETFVNGVSVESKQVTQLDKIELGSSRYVFDWGLIAEVSPVLIDIRDHSLESNSAAAAVHFIQHKIQIPARHTVDDQHFIRKSMNCRRQGYAGNGAGQKIPDDGVLRGGIHVNHPAVQAKSQGAEERTLGWILDIEQKAFRHRRTFFQVILSHYTPLTADFQSVLREEIHLKAKGRI